MGTWILTAKTNVSSPVSAYCSYGSKPYEKKRDLEKGFTIKVAAPSTGGPNHQDVVGALLLAGFFKEEAEEYCNSSWEYYFSGEKISDETDSELHNKQFKAQQNREQYSLKKILKSPSKSSVQNIEKDEDNEYSTRTSSSRSSSHSSSSSSSSSSSGMSTCTMFLLTITLVLPIWWVLKLPFTMGWAGIKLIYYIISWPFRLLFCCCCNTKMIPEDNLGAWPKYGF